MKLNITDISKQIEDKNKSDYDSKRRDLDITSQLSAQDATQRAIVEVAKSLLGFMAKHEPNVTVKNHPKFPTSILTPDIKAVVDKLSDLIVVSQSKEPNLSVLEVKLRDILEQLKQLPKNIPEFPELPEPVKEITVLNQPDFKKAFDRLEKAIKSIDVKPVVKTTKQDVKIDTKPIADVIAKLEAALIASVSSIEPSQTVFDTKALEDTIKRVENAINALEFPIAPSRTISETAQTNLESLQFNDNGELKTDANIDMDTEGIATSANQTSGSQKTKIVDSGGDVVDTFGTPDGATETTLALIKNTDGIKKITDTVTVQGTITTNANSGTATDTSVTLTNASTAYALPTSAPTKAYSILITNTHATATVYIRYTTGTTVGHPINAGKLFAKDVCANRTLFAYSATAGVVLNISYEEIN